jgi:hypothetical protein
MAVSKQQEFQILIESIVKDGLSSYIDVIGEYMEENEVTEKQMIKLISPILKEKIRIEAIEKRLIFPPEGEVSTLPL